MNAFEFLLGTWRITSSFQRPHTREPGSLQGTLRVLPVLGGAWVQIQAQWRDDLGSAQAAHYMLRDGTPLQRFRFGSNGSVVHSCSDGWHKQQLVWDGVRTLRDGTSHAARTIYEQQGVDAFRILEQQMSDTGEWFTALPVDCARSLPS